MAMRLTIDWSNWDRFRVHYYSQPTPRALRFGQAFCNRFLPEGISWPELFYECDDAKAGEIIYNSVDFIC